MKVIEKRKFRVDLEIRVELRPLNQDKRFYAEILDISEGGFKFKIETRDILEVLSEGSLLRFRTDLEFYGIKGLGKIVWISKEKDMAGIDFVKMDQQSKNLLKDFLKVCGQ